MNAGCHGGDWAEVVRAGDGGRRTRAGQRARAGATSRSPTGGAGWTAGSCWRRPCSSGPRSRRDLDEQVAELFEWRQKGTPFNQPCCGSVFKNPSGPSWKRESGPRTAGQLIEAAGLKGFRIGGAEVSPMHANYFVNTGGATAADVRALDRAWRSGTVEEQFGVRLEPEVKLIGRAGGNT